MPNISVGNNWIRIGNMQICWGNVSASAGKQDAKFTYQQKFIENPTIFSSHRWTHMDKGTVTIGAIGFDYADILIYEAEYDFSRERMASVLAIGRWK